MIGGAMIQYMLTELRREGRYVTGLASDQVDVYRFVFLGLVVINTTVIFVKID
jgi:hypothetical protein